MPSIFEGSSVRPGVHAIAEIARGLDRGVKAHLLGGSENPPSEGTLHERFASRNGQPAFQRVGG